MIARKLLLNGQRATFKNMLLCSKAVRARIYRDNQLWHSAYSKFFTAEVGIFYSYELFRKRASQTVRARASLLNRFNVALISDGGSRHGSVWDLKYENKGPYEGSLF